MRITHKQLIMVVASLVLVIAVAGSVALARRSAPRLVPLKSIPTSKKHGGSTVGAISAWRRDEKCPGKLLTLYADAA